MKISSFFSRFLMWFLIFQSVVWLTYTIPALANSIQSTLASVVIWFYSLFSNGATSDGNIIKHVETGRFLVIDQYCTGFTLVATLVAGLMALHISWTNKFFAAIIAILFIQFENIFRITHLFYEIKQPINNFEIYHLYIWQGINFITALLTFYIIVRLFKQKETNVFK